MKRLLLLLLFVTVGFAMAAKPIEHRSASEGYVDPEIKVTFPAAAGVFRKQEVIRSSNPLIGTSVRYLDQTGHCADIYIYTLSDPAGEISEAAFQQHQKEMESIILGLPAKGVSVKSVTVSERKKLLNQNDLLRGSTTVFQILWEDGSKQNSVLSLFSFRGRIIKLRITGTNIDADLFTKEILKSFPAQKK